MIDDPSSSGRRAGVSVPLSSCPSTRGWGIGEFSDLPLLAGWLRGAGFRFVLLLPLNEVMPGQHSPYSAASAMALDPIFIRVPAVADFKAIGGLAAMAPDEAAAIKRARGSRRVEHDAIRAVKERALRTAFEYFEQREWAEASERANEFRLFADEQRWWLDDYALYRAIHHAHGGQDWQGWPAPLRRREPAALEAARRDLASEVRYRRYLQWIAHGQWRAARAEARDVRVFGDLPFGVSGDSADTWANQDLFSFDATMGAPPDAFSDEGQNWAVPVYRWDAIAARGYEWFRTRARRIRDLFDGYRIDHVVGLFRTWVFPLDGGAPHFTPAQQFDQVALGRAVLRALGSAGGEIVAEDLGTIPDFVRGELRALGIPGYRVLRWEREWHAPGQPYRDPAGYPAASIATSGTHDTETIAAWWETLPADERAAVLAIPAVRGRLAGTDRVIDALLETLFASGSDLLLLPVQDLFGWPDRINVPGLVNDDNWTWRLPWPVDRLDREPGAAGRQTVLRGWAAQYRRI